MALAAFELNIAAVFSILEDIGVIDHDVFLNVLLADFIAALFFRTTYAKQKTVDTIKEYIKKTKQDSDDLI